MIRPGKVRTVASFEFLTTVRRKAYVITTFGMPVFVLMYLGLFGLIGVATEKKEGSEVRVFGVVDGSVRTQAKRPSFEVKKAVPGATRPGTRWYPTRSPRVGPAGKAP